MPTGIFILIALMFAAPSYAQVYKCKTLAGETLISSNPCQGQNKTIAVRQSEQVSEEQYRQAAEVNLQRKNKLSQLAAEEAAFQERIAAQAAAIRNTASPEQDAHRKKLCSEASRPLPGAHGLTASQRSILASCAGLPAPPVHDSPQRNTAQIIQSNAPAPPGIITNCDGGGCWDTSGRRYNNVGGGNTHRSDGKFCQKIGNEFHCH